MFNVISILIGLVALLIAVIGIFPIISLVNWIAFPIAVVGLAFGLLSRGTAGRNLNLLVLLVSGLRLWLTGGIL
ncbi:hypothetical protein [Sphingomonas sp. dw_22]|uniref:hypothetical protein n=1 Tax=Sphingomonas sp. dw_22 TaxID=2721175 RepID=UPI001BD6D6F9|nr:hypothetical protein [Sphingomonas sp. dw_22]